jgi:hypothetical protein
MLRVKINGLCGGNDGTLGRPRRRLVGNITMDLLELRWSDVDWIGLAQDRNK